MNNPRVYVGTYGKYNNGSLAGGWVSLLECKDYQDFLSKCRALHRREHDPEYMIQDSEDFPDGLDCMEWIDEKDFNDVIAACKEAEQEDSITDKLRQALMAQLKAVGKSVSADSQMALLEEYMQEWQKVWPGDSSMLDYERKGFSGAVRLENGGILYFNKPHIETKFCFHDEGPDYEFYKQLMNEDERLKAYFLRENMKDYDQDIEELSEAHEWDSHEGLYIKNKRLYIQRRSYSSQTEPLNLWTWRTIDDWEVQAHPSFYPDIEPMTESDRQTILAGVRSEREKFEKRLNTYLKRYGTSKLHTWTYWADA